MSARTGRRAVVIGAGMGGLTAALRLARAGFEVEVIEARADAGGLASGFEIEGFTFDGGPYILLDRPGLAWALDAVEIDIDRSLSLQRIDAVYQVEWPDGQSCRFASDRVATADRFEALWPGAGGRYLAFVRQTAARYERLASLQRVTRPGPMALIAAGALQDAPFLLRPLGGVLAETGLPTRLQHAVGIWTQIAGQPLDRAPAPLAFVPALIHGQGSYYPVGGIGAVPALLFAEARRRGIAFRFNARVKTISHAHGRATGVLLDTNEAVHADVVVCNAAGAAAYLEMLDLVPAADRAKLERLPLQSPGVCAYLAVRRRNTGPYLRFLLPEDGGLCRLLICPGNLDPTLERDGWQPARLMSPMRYPDAQALGSAGQLAYLERILGETWWRTDIEEVRTLARRTPTTWGREYNLFRNSMNPVMTSEFMRAGRMAHRSKYLKRLYLAGSSTHPGQWVSFCAISGVLAANLAIEEAG